MCFFGRGGAQKVDPGFMAVSGFLPRRESRGVCRLMSVVGKACQPFSHRRIDRVCRVWDCKKISLFSLLLPSLILHMGQGDVRNPNAR